MRQAPEPDGRIELDDEPGPPPHRACDRSSDDVGDLSDARQACPMSADDSRTIPAPPAIARSGAGDALRRVLPLVLFGLVPVAVTCSMLAIAAGQRAARVGLPQRAVPAGGGTARRSQSVPGGALAALGDRGRDAVHGASSRRGRLRVRGRRARLLPRGARGRRRARLAGLRGRAPVAVGDRRDPPLAPDAAPLPPARARVAHARLDGARRVGARDRHGPEVLPLARRGLARRHATPRSGALAAAIARRLAAPRAAVRGPRGLPLDRRRHGPGVRPGRLLRVRPPDPARRRRRGRSHGDGRSRRRPARRHLASAGASRPRSPRHSSSRRSSGSTSTRSPRSRSRSFGRVCRRSGCCRSSRGVSRAPGSRPTRSGASDGCSSSSRSSSLVADRAERTRPQASAAVRASRRFRRAGRAGESSRADRRRRRRRRSGRCETTVSGTSEENRSSPAHGEDRVTAAIRRSPRSRRRDRSSRRGCRSHPRRARGATPSEGRRPREPRARRAGRTRPRPLRQSSRSTARPSKLDVRAEPVERVAALTEERCVRCAVASTAR